MAARKVMGVFAFTSLLMWAFPIGVLQVFNRNLIPGLENMSSQSRTLWSGGLAVFSVNLVIGVYIYLALREPATVAPQPDPAFVRRAKGLQAELVGTSSTVSKAQEGTSSPESAEKSGKSD